jgi:hypothetical protein
VILLVTASAVYFVGVTRLVVSAFLRGVQFGLYFGNPDSPYIPDVGTVFACDSVDYRFSSLAVRHVGIIP